MDRESMPEIMNSQPPSAGSAFRLKSAPSKQDIKPHGSVPGTFGSSVFAFKERGFRHQRKTGVPSTVQPVFDLKGEIVTEGDEANTSFARPNMKTIAPEIDVHQAQSERFADPQSRAI
jgi:hypothetical protein